jgi:hypothetical protein
MKTKSNGGKKKVLGKDPKDFFNKVKVNSINVLRTEDVYELCGDRISYVLFYVNRE